MTRATLDPRELTLQPCTPKDFTNLLEFLDSAFRKPEKHWFAKHLTHIFNRQPASVACHNMVKIDGRIAGVIGIYPLRWKIGRTVLNVGGIGSVSAHADSRGKGVMSAMLKQVIARMESGGYDISWLGGDRYRYANYGWELGGRHTRFIVARRDVVRYYPSIRPARCRVVRSGDIPTVARLFERQTVRTIRPADAWPIHLKRKALGWTVTDGDEGQAYIAFDKDQPRNVAEVCGATTATVGLVLAHMRKYKLDRLVVPIPAHNRSLHRLFYRISTSFSLHHNAQVRVINIASTWNKLKGHAAAQLAPEDPAVARELLDTVESDTDRRVLLGRLLGFFDTEPAMPPRLKAFDRLRPVEWWMSAVDGV